VNSFLCSVLYIHAERDPVPVQGIISEVGKNAEVLIWERR
jgi:hypothetical protein